MREAVSGNVNDADFVRLGRVGELDHPTGTVVQRFFSDEAGYSLQDPYRNEESM
jgi:hypothetical protein